MPDRHSSHLFKLIVWSCVGLFIALFFILPIFNFYSASINRESLPATESGDQTLAEVILLHAASLITTFFFFAAGAAVGSYLNVIIYRIPRKIPLALSRSKCPKCGSPILSSDNIPIIGWLRLKGRCRACQAPISARYPIIETLVAVIFLILYFRELLSGGANLPVRPTNLYNGVLWILFYTKWDLVRLYLLHCLMLTTILGWVMMNVDGFHVPRSSLFTVLCLVYLSLFAWPDLLPVPYSPAISTSALTLNRSQALMTAGCGTLTGGLLGLILAGAISRIRSIGFSKMNSLFYAFILCGTVYGWQTMPIIALISVAMLLIQQIGSRFYDRPLLQYPGYAIFAAIFLTHFYWRSLVW